MDLQNEEMVAVSQQEGIISCDFEGAKARLQKRLEEYKGAVFTEESRTVAKAEVAGLRKEKKEFSDRVKEVKAAYMKPYVEFENKAKELIAMYDEPINLIDGQIKDFEEKRKAEKRVLIESIYNKYAGELSWYMPLERVYNSKWENATMKQKDIEKEMADLAASVREALNTIRMRESEATDKALEVYKKNLSLPEALAYINSYEKQKADILAREQECRRQEEQERIRREERARLEAERRALEEKEALQRRLEEEKAIALEQERAIAAQEVIDGLIPSFSGMAELYEYRVELTADAKEKLEMYMDSVGIEWELM